MWPSNPVAMHSSCSSTGSSLQLVTSRPFVPPQEPSKGPATWPATLFPIRTNCRGQLALTACFRVCAPVLNLCTCCSTLAACGVVVVWCWALNVLCLYSPFTVISCLRLCHTFHVALCLSAVMAPRLDTHTTMDVTVASALLGQKDASASWRNMLLQK